MTALYSVAFGLGLLWEKAIGLVTARPPTVGIGFVR